MPSTVVNAIAEMMANNSSLKLRANSGAAILVSVVVERAARHRAQAHVQREHVKEADAGDADDRALARGRLVLDGVIADKDVRQRRRAAEQGQHQRDEIQLVRKARRLRMPLNMGCSPGRRIWLPGVGSWFVGRDG